jgi:hypothetical protein
MNLVGLRVLSMRGRESKLPSSNPPIISPIPWSVRCHYLTNFDRLATPEDVKPVNFFNTEPKSEGFHVPDSFRSEKIVTRLSVVAGLHESLNSVIEPSWAWGGLIISVLLGVYFIPFLRTLPRTSFRDFVVSGVVYVGGAVGMELVGQPLDGDALPYNMSTMVEEGMEIFGIILFIRALLSYMSNDKTEIEVEFTV